jgi:hypothetical protein
MKIIIGIFLLLNFSITYSQNNKCNCKNLKKGVFEIYEKGEKIGRVYRKGNYQLEDYFNGKDLSKVRINNKNCIFYLKSYTVKEDIDTLTMLIKYKKIKNNHYSFTGKTAYLKNGYRYNGEIKKIRNRLDKNILTLFIKLEKGDG